MSYILAVDEVDGEKLYGWQVDFADIIVNLSEELCFKNRYGSCEWEAVVDLLEDGTLVFQSSNMLDDLATRMGRLSVKDHDVVLIKVPDRFDTEDIDGLCEEVVLAIGASKNLLKYVDGKAEFDPEKKSHFVVLAVREGIELHAHTVEEKAAELFDAYNTAGPSDTHYKLWNGQQVLRWHESPSSVKAKWLHVAKKALGLLA